MVEVLFWGGLGGVVGAVACRTEFVEEHCAPMTLEGVPIGTYPTTGLPYVLDGGVIEVTDTEVRLSFEHEEWGQVDAVYTRVGGATCYGCD